jgi:DnaJ domain
MEEKFFTGGGASRRRRLGSTRKTLKRRATAFRGRRRITMRFVQRNGRETRRILRGGTSHSRPAPKQHPIRSAIGRAGKHVRSGASAVARGTQRATHSVLQRGRKLFGLKPKAKQVNLTKHRNTQKVHISNKKKSTKAERGAQHRSQAAKNIVGKSKSNIAANRKARKQQQKNAKQQRAQKAINKGKTPNVRKAKIQKKTAKNASTLKKLKSESPTQFAARKKLHSERGEETNEEFEARKASLKQKPAETDKEFKKRQDGLKKKPNESEEEFAARKASLEKKPAETEKEFAARKAGLKKKDAEQMKRKMKDDEGKQRKKDTNSAKKKKQEESAKKKRNANENFKKKRTNEEDAARKRGEEEAAAKKKADAAAKPKRRGLFGMIGGPLGALAGLAGSALGALAPLLGSLMSAAGQAAGALGNMLGDGLGGLGSLLGAAESAGGAMMGPNGEPLTPQQQACVQNKVGECLKQIIQGRRNMIIKALDDGKKDKDLLDVITVADLEFLTIFGDTCKKQYDSCISGGDGSAPNPDEASADAEGTKEDTAAPPPPPPATAAPPPANSGSSTNIVVSSSNPAAEAAGEGTSAAPSAPKCGSFTGQTCYEILGVPQDADEDAIKKAFRKLALEKHPNKGGNQEEFARINAAKGILTDPDEKAKYDQTL